jgi:hypothetical protein
MGSYVAVTITQTFPNSLAGYAVAANQTEAPVS